MDKKELKKYIDLLPKNCRNCGDVGSKKCGGCNVIAGIVDGIYRNLYSDPPSPEMVCPDCKGNGKRYKYTSSTPEGMQSGKCPKCNGTGKVPSPEPPEKVITGELTDEEIWKVQVGNSDWDDYYKGRAVAKAQILKLQQAGWGQLDGDCLQCAQDLKVQYRAEARQQAFQEAKQWLDELFKKGVSSFKYTSYSEGTYYLTFPYDDFTAVQNKIKSEQPKE